MQKIFRRTLQKFFSNLVPTLTKNIETFKYRYQRLKMRFHFLFSSAFLFAFVRNQFLDFKFVNPLKHKKLSDSSIVLKEYNSIVESQCVINCAANTKCGSVNYHKETQTCILNGRSSRNDDLKNLLIDAKGWTFFEKSEVRRRKSMSPQFINFFITFLIFCFIFTPHIFSFEDIKTRFSKISFGFQSKI